MESRHPQDKVTIIGGGIVGALKAYRVYLEAKKAGKQIRVTVHEKNPSISDTTTGHIVPSLTPDEILSVVPRGDELVRKLQILFSEPGGIRVDDVTGVRGTSVTDHFIAKVQEYSLDEEGHQERTKVLLELGKRSMELWQQLYETADPALKKILEESNFNPCREPNGYRIDLICNIPDAKNKALGMITDYEGLGYKSCKILSPQEVKARDPFLIDFCDNHSVINESGERQWRNDAVALWRPGGCIDTQTFLPKLYSYLTQEMGQYRNESGQLKDCFQLRLERKVVEVTYSPEDASMINGLRFFGRSKVKQDKHHYQHSDYVFCPGEAVGTLKNLGFNEPAYARFAGASLMLNIPLTDEKLKEYATFNHCMEVHQEGVVLAWQARLRNNKIFIGVAGTKAFYSDQKPDKNQAFAMNRNLLQLNIINRVLPKIISLALGKPTAGVELTAADLAELENNGIAERWVGSRAVAYDGVPTVGTLYKQTLTIKNAETITHLGSGGGSFSCGSIEASAEANNPDASELTQKVLRFGSSNR